MMFVVKQKNGNDIRIFPSKSEYNYIILQVNLHAFHV
jgi:hypothetical protein